MALDLRASCERCTANLDPDGEAYICSFECTYCAACFGALAAVCPNCGDELVRRPRRTPA